MTSATNHGGNPRIAELITLVEGTGGELTKNQLTRMSTLLALDLVQIGNEFLEEMKGIEKEAEIPYGRVKEIEWWENGSIRRIELHSPFEEDGDGNKDNIVEGFA